MLVISRHHDQALLLTDERTGNVVRLVVVDIHGDKVRLGIEAEQHIRIDRAECPGVHSNANRPRQEATSG